jgi:GNAT superfamily N-acetyltransferase
MKVGPQRERDETVRLAQRCFAEVVKEMARRSGGAALEEHGLLLVAGNHPCPVLMNSVLRMEPMDANEVLRRAAIFFAERGHSYEIWTRTGVDDDLENAALAVGMRFSAELTGMVIHRNPELPECDAGVELRRVQDIQGVRDFTNVAADGFLGEGPGISELVRATFSDSRSLLADDTAAFVVWDHGEPAAVAMTMVKEGVAWIGWVATRAESRGRGLGRLSTAAATRAGFAFGAKFASLEATKMGAPVYLRLGYQEIVNYRNYWPADLQL